MKRFLTLSMLALSLTGVASAHELAHDGNVGGLLHIEPDDNPVVGKPNVAWFELSLRGGAALALNSCACTLNVYAGSLKPGAAAQSSPALKIVNGRLQASLSFPKVGAYTLVLSGQPRAGANFKAFSLNWVVRADVGAQ